MNNIDRKYKKAVIFSVFTEDGNKECKSRSLSSYVVSQNDINHEDTRQDLKKFEYSFKEVDGYYKNKIEQSFYVEYEKDSDLYVLLGIAAAFNQEAVLLIDEDRNASLLFSENNSFAHSLPQSIGKFTQVSENEALRHDAYTHDYLNGGFYICE